MRGVSRWASRVAPLLAVFLVLTSWSVWAEEPPAPPTDPPEARMNPPVGVTAQARMQPPVGVTAQARLGPPVGETTQARMQPPVGLTLMDIIRLWLQSRLSVPNGERV